MINHRTILLMLSFACCSTMLPMTHDSRESLRRLNEQLKLNEQYIAQLRQLPSIIDSNNVHTPLKDIPGLICKDEHNFPLVFAAEKSSLLRFMPDECDEIFNYLFAVGADPNRYRFTVSCPLRHISMLNRPNLVEKFIVHGAKIPPNILARLMDGHEDFDLKPEIINLLVQHGAGVNEQGPYEKRSALHFTACHVVMQCLLSHGANILAQDVNGKSALDCIKSRNNPKTKSILQVFDALQTNQSTDPDAKYLVSAYLIFQQGDHEPLRQMLIRQPWVLCQLTRNKQMPKDEEWIARGKPIAGNAFAVERMTIACQQAFKPECIKPLIRYLALAQTDGRTMCERKQMMEMYNVALDAKPEDDDRATVATPSKIEELD